MAPTTQSRPGQPPTEQKLGRSFFTLRPAPGRGCAAWVLDAALPRRLHMGAQLLRIENVDEYCRSRARIWLLMAQTPAVPLHAPHTRARAHIHTRARTLLPLPAGCPPGPARPGTKEPELNTKAGPHGCVGTCKCAMGPACCCVNARWDSALGKDPSCWCRYHTGLFKYRQLAMRAVLLGVLPTGHVCWVCIPPVPT